MNIRFSGVVQLRGLQLPFNSQKLGFNSPSTTPPKRLQLSFISPSTTLRAIPLIPLGELKPRPCGRGHSLEGAVVPVSSAAGCGVKQTYGSAQQLRGGNTATEGPALGIPLRPVLGEVRP